MPRIGRDILTFVKFAFVGGIGLCITLAITHILTEYAALWYFLAFIIATLAAWTFVFFANALFSFRDVRTELTIQRYGAFLLGYLSFFWISASLVYSLTSLVGVPYILSITAGTITTTILTFFFSKFVIFAPGERVSLALFLARVRAVPFSGWALVGIILLALMLRLPGIHYGLPLHLIADEEVNVYAALKMIELKTLFPVLHPDAFVPLLYEPPMTAYVNVLFFVPTIALLYAGWGFPAIADFKDMLLIDTSVFWFVARFVGVLLSLCNIYLVYRIARNFFADASIALFAGLFLATSFLDVTISNTARHWTLGILFSLISLVLVQEAFKREGKARLYLLALSGAALGFSFGTSYLVYYLPFLGLYVIYLSLGDARFAWRDFLRTDVVRTVLYFASPFVVLSLAMLVVDPFAFKYQVLTPGTESAWKDPLEFLGYYARTLWNFETPLLLFALFGYIRLFFTKRMLFGIIGALLFTAVILMYLFLNYLTRYVAPLLPILAILAGYGFHESLRLFPYKKATAVLVALLVFYVGGVYGKYTHLMAANDTRYRVKQWVESSIPAHANVIVYSSALRLQGSRESLMRQQELSPGSLRSNDRALLASPRLATHPLTLSSLFFLSEAESERLIALALASSSDAYLIVDSWAPERASVQMLALRGRHAARFEGGDVAGTRDLLVGGDYTGADMHVLKLLYGATHLGPDVVVYSLQL